MPIALEDFQKFASDWIELIEKRGVSVKEFAKTRNRTERWVYEWRDKCQKALGVSLRVCNNKQRAPDLLPILDNVTLEGEQHLIIGSDWHIWPGYYSRAEDAFLEALRTTAYDAVILNGDVTDQCRVSRHDPLQGISPPSLFDELTEAQTRLKEVAKLAKKKNPDVRLLWNFGNHDVRAWRHVALMAPEIAPLFDFERLFPDWEFNTTITCNRNLMIKHRWHSGLHAALNNTRSSGMSIVTGHTHRLLVTPWSDYMGTRYGIETGTLADPRGPQFTFVESNPVNWQPGFIEIFADEHDVHAERIDCSRRTIRRLGKPLKVA